MTERQATTTILVECYEISGNTYRLRRELRAAGCFWNRSRGAYLVARGKSERALKIAADNDLNVEQSRTPAADLEPLTGDTLRQYRQDKKDRYAARLLDRAHLADARAQKARDRISPQEREFLSLGEPVKVGHHSERRHRKLIAKFNKSFEDTGREYAKAEGLRNKARYLAPARIKGDAARAAQARRDAADALISKGDLVENVVYGRGIVEKVNKKTYTIAFKDGGYKTTLDKGWCKLVEKRQPVEPEWRFKPGDQVVCFRLARRYHGTVKRRTARGYSVEYTAPWGTERETFSPDQVFGSEEECIAGQKAIGL